MPKRQRSEIPVGVEEETLVEDLFGGGGFKSSLEEERDSAKKGRSVEFAENDTKQTKDAPAWVDEDEEELQVNVAAAPRLRKLRKDASETMVGGEEYESRLRQEFHRRVGGEAAWARVDKEKDDAAGILGRTTASALGSSKVLPRDTLHVVRASDANIAEAAKGVVSRVEFHPGGAPVAMVASLDKHLRFFEIDGDTNRRVHGTWFEDLPPRDAAFVRGGDCVLAVGRRKFFYVYDMVHGRAQRVPELVGREERSWESIAVPKGGGGEEWAFLGNSGEIVLVGARTLGVTGVLPVSRGSVTCACFSTDGTTLWASGSAGLVHGFDLRMRRCVVTFGDEGGSFSTSLEVSNDDRFLAVGSKSGVVNLYHTNDQLLDEEITKKAEDEEDFFMEPPTSRKPLKSLNNLTTSIGGVRFANDGQAMAMWSRTIKDQLRIVHVNSQTVFQNWPTKSTPLGHVQSVDFSPNGGYVAIGNDKGRVLLYRLSHFENY